MMPPVTMIRFTLTAMRMRTMPGRMPTMPSRKALAAFLGRRPATRPEPEPATRKRRAVIGIE